MKPAPITRHFRYPTRRAVLRGLAGVSLLGLAGLGLPGCADLENINEWSFGGPGLGALAREKSRQYGAALQSWQLKDDAFADVLIREAGLLVPENELKWSILRPSPHAFDFSGYDKIAAFARDNHIAMRGHTLVWHYANPGWLAPALAKRRDAEKILETHITRVIKHTSPLIRNWDVVNEAVDPHSKREDGLRESLWLKALGPDYVAHAFHLAHKANPALTLVYNDYGMEREGNDGRSKRQSILRLLERCVRDKVPVHALGLQSHLDAHRPMAGAEFAAFLKEVRAQGLQIFITEMDLNVSYLSGNIQDKITLAQNYARAYLDLVQESGGVDMLLTWGLSDRYTWLRQMHPHIAGTLPLDGDLNRGPLWGTLRDGWLGS